MYKPESLPIDAFIPEICAQLARTHAVVLTAEPGAGKTTRLPPALLKVLKGQILVLEPRRMAAMAAAQRVAQENDWNVGEQVGYQVRFENKTSKQTKLIFMTEALLARRLTSDPQLEGVDAVVLDEFHERSLHVDLALGLLKELRDLGRDIKIVVMSATLHAESISRYLDDAPVITVPGKLHPLMVHHSATSQRPLTDQDFYTNLVKLVQTAHAQTKRDILVFLPGLGEIERTAERLGPWAEQNQIKILTLHGSLPLEQQREVLNPGTGQRVILSTNVAESSVTINGVDTVVDSGLAKVMRHDHRSGFSRLTLSRISQSSATQRSGRAARQWPGHCYRLWSKSDERSFPANEVAEILRSDLSESLLFLAAQGIRDFHQFPWFEMPPDVALDKARAELLAIEAIDAHGAITPLGREMLELPLPPRLARLMLVARAQNRARLGADLAAILQERDFIRREALSAHAGDNLECDITLRHELLQKARSGKSSGDILGNRVRTTLAAAAQILGRERVSSVGQTDSTDAIKRLLLQTFPDRLCRQRGNEGRALMVGGRGVRLSPHSLVKNSEFFVALEGVENPGQADTLVNLACGFTKEFVLEGLKERITLTQDVTYDENRRQFYARRFRSFLGLALDEPTLSVPSADEVQSRLADVLAQRLEFVRKENTSLDDWLSRWEFFARSRGASANLALTQDKLVSAFTEAAMGETSMGAVTSKDLRFHFENQFAPALINEFHSAVPEKIQVPSGSWIKVSYPQDNPPYLEVRIQEVFGLVETPKVMQGKIPITLHLLGPNFRPVQVTSDLPSFWKNGYPEVRKELRARYPKHSWPDDPLTAPAVAKGRRRT